MVDPSLRCSTTAVCVCVCVGGGGGGGACTYVGQCVYVHISQ